MSHGVVLGLVLVCGLRRIATGEGVTRDDPTIEIQVGSDVPFTPEQLEAALRMRLEPGAQPVLVVVHAIDGGVVVAMRGQEREVPLSGRSGSSAARLVALTAIDLMLPDLPSVPRLPASEGDDEPPERIAFAPRSLVAKREVAVTALGSTALWSSVMASAGIDMVVPLGKTLVTGELTVGTLVAGDLHLTSGHARIGVAARRGVIEFRVGVTLAPLVVRDGDGDITMLVGGGGSARVRLPIAGALRVVFAAGVDGFVTRTEYTRVGMPTISTPWLAPWIAIGLQVMP